MYFLSIVASAGCTSTSQLSQSDLRVSADHTIIVYALDGRVMRFNSGDYKIIEEGMESIQGKGKLYIDKSMNAFKDFEGTISFIEIKEIRSPQTTILGTAGTILVLAPVVLIGLLLLFPPHISME